MATPAIYLKEILEKTTSSVYADQQKALHYIEEATRINLPEFLGSLAEVIRNADNSLVARQAAGLQLKNCLTSKDETVKLAHQTRWLSLPESVRITVKTNVVQTLGTESTRPSIAAQCVAAIACAELPQNLWPECITILRDNVTNVSSTEMLKESSLEAIGYICSDIDPAVLSSRSNEILTAIVHGMKKQEPSNHVRLAATVALLNSLEFTKSNFEIENERHIIMQVVCEASQSQDTQVRVAALQCLVKIMSLYYQYMEQYMGVALFAISVDAMKSDVDEISLQGIEFWSNVCDEEIALAIESEEANEQGRPPQHVSRFYAKGALQYLVPILTATLSKQEGDDEDEWNPPKAAGVCLMLLAQGTGDDIISHTLPFIIQNINSPDWRLRDAAVMAFGSILEGPDADKLKPLVLQAMPLLINLLQDNNIVVKDTAAWVLGRVCDVVPDIVIVPEVLSPLLPALSQGLQQEARVAANVCWAISSLAEAAYESAKEASDDGEVPTYILSTCFDAMVTELLKTTERSDAHQSNLRNAAYEALMELIKNSPGDCYETVQKTTIIVLHRLQGLLVMEHQIASTNERSQFHDLQSLLCATLQNVMRKMKPSDAPQISDVAMSTLIQILSCSNAGKVGGVQEDAIMAVSTLIEVLGDGFIKYMDLFKPYLIIALKNHAEYQVCAAAVGLVGDLCRSLNEKMLPHTDELMQNLLEILTDESVDKNVKPQVLSSFGDVALAIGKHFVNYMPTVMQTLTHATTAQVDRSDYDAVDYLNSLREGCLEAYTGIVQGSKDDIQLIQPHLVHIVQFLRLIGEDNPNDSLMAACAGLIGDLVSVFGNHIVPLLEQCEPIVTLLTRARKAKNSKTKTLATWATKEMKKYKSAGN